MGLPFGKPFRKLRRHRRGAASFPGGAPPSPWAGTPVLGEGGAIPAIDGAGTFASGGPQTIPPNRCMICFAGSGYSAVLTGVYRNGQSIAFPAFAAIGVPQRFSGSVFQAVKPSAADADIYWFTVPDGPYSPFDNPLQTSVLPFVTVGPAGSNYPITSTAAAGGAAATINAAIVAVNAAKGGTVQICGGAAVTYWLESTIIPLEKVNIYTDGCVLEAKNGAAFTPLFGNGPTQTLTNLEFVNLSLNSNGANGGFTPQSISPTTATAYVVGTLTGVTTGTVTVRASAAVTHVSINGLTDANSSLPLAGPWYCTPTDTITFTFSAAQTFTYTQNIDGWWTYNTYNCSWISCGPWSPGQSTAQIAAGTGQAGLAFNLDSGSVQNSSENSISITGPVSSGCWMAALRYNGSSTYLTPENTVWIMDFSAVYYRGIDLAQRSDTNFFYYIRVPAGTAAGYVGLWVGSAGTSITNAYCNRQNFQNLTMDNASVIGANYIVFGYYNNDGTNPSVFADNWFHGGGGSAYIVDLRATPLYDYDLVDTQFQKIYGAGPLTYLVNGQTNQLGVAATVASYNGAAAGTVSVTAVMAGLGYSMNPKLQLTPQTTGIVEISFTGDGQTATAATQFMVQVRYGTGAGAPSGTTPPSNGDNPTGTTVGSEQATAGKGIATQTAFGRSVIITGLALGTQYWFDLGYRTSNAADAASLAQVDVTIKELAA